MLTPYHIRMHSVIQNILQAKAAGKKLLAILVDPDKFDPAIAPEFMRGLPKNATHIFIGGSTVNQGETQELVKAFKSCTAMPLVLFPGDYTQLAPQANAVLYLSLLSGSNPEYLVGQQLKAVPFLNKNKLEVIPTGYILIDGGNESAVAKVTQTEPLSQEASEQIVSTAKMSEYLGKQLVYLEAGSGAQIPVAPDIIKQVREVLNIPLVVGGGIRTQEQLQIAYQAGADMVVMGTAFES